MGRHESTSGNHRAIVKVSKNIQRYVELVYVLLHVSLQHDNALCSEQVIAVWEQYGEAPLNKNGNRWVNLIPKLLEEQHWIKVWIIHWTRSIHWVWKWVSHYNSGTVKEINNSQIGACLWDHVRFPAIIGAYRSHLCCSAKRQQEADELVFLSC